MHFQLLSKREDAGKTNAMRSSLCTIAVLTIYNTTALPRFNLACMRENVSIAAAGSFLRLALLSFSGKELMHFINHKEDLSILHRNPAPPTCLVGANGTKQLIFPRPRYYYLSSCRISFLSPPQAPFNFPSLRFADLVCRKGMKIRTRR